MGYTSRGATRFPSVPTLYSACACVCVYIYDTPQTPGVYLGLFADDTCIYVTHHKEGYVLRKLQRGLSAIEMWCEHCNIKINEDKTRAMYFSHRLRPRGLSYTEWMEYLLSIM
jgi:hypothetical protein